MYDCSEDVMEMAVPHSLMNDHIFQQKEISKFQRDHLRTWMTSKVWIYEEQIDIDKKDKEYSQRIGNIVENICGLNSQWKSVQQNNYN